MISGHTVAIVVGWMLVAAGFIPFALLAVLRDWASAAPFIAPVALGVVLLVYSRSLRS